ncbi:MAG: CDP-glycerol glycerophosphotransferase family protein [Coriobacteriia bacterium]|nr:CDP-glycerol glycerophosphotransferase family protein [Coriobacteriia bacterium]
MLNSIRQKLYELMVEGRLLEAVFHKMWSLFLKGCHKIGRGIGFLFGLPDRAIRHFARKHLEKHTEIDKHTILFLTYQGVYTCNPKAIANEMLKQKLPYRLVWMTRKKDQENTCPAGIEAVKRDSFACYEAAAVAKVIIDNTHNLSRIGIAKKPGQVLLQTWHGSLGIKRLDGEVVKNKEWDRLAQICQRDTDYCISNSSFETEVYRESYWGDVPVLTYGHARNDILFSTDQEQLDRLDVKVRRFFEIKLKTKIALYAPTHKDNGYEYLYDLDYFRIREALEKKFGGTWIIAVRFHSRLSSRSRRWLASAPSFVFDATAYPDIQELMLSTSVGLTDYSSWVFDYILLKRPVFIIADDIEDFSQKRSFYYPLESTPFSIATNSHELVNNIDNFNEVSYLQQVNDFLKDKGCMEDGHAAERIVAKIKELTS